MTTILEFLRETNECHGKTNGLPDRSSPVSVDRSSPVSMDSVQSTQSVYLPLHPPYHLVIRTKKALQILSDKHVPSGKPDRPLSGHQRRPRKKKSRGRKELDSISISYSMMSYFIYQPEKRTWLYTFS